MARVCPVSFRSIDGTISRLNALTVSLLLVAFIVTHEMVLLLILGYDFVVRVYAQKNLSPIYQLSRLIKKLLDMPTATVDAGAKRLAAQLGIFFVLILVVASVFQWYIFAMVIASLFLLCTSLEFFFSFCIGCEIYFLVHKFY